MSINSILNTGSKGMTVSTAQTQVASNNVSNAAVDGYTRRTVVAYPENVLTRSGNSMRVVEPFIQKRLLNAQSGSSEASANRVAVETLDQVFDEGEGNVGPALDQFQVAIQDLNVRPDDPATRQQLLVKTDALGVAFRHASDTLDAARIDNNGRIEANIKAVNTRLHQIAKLGGEISIAEVSDVEASDLRDQRDILIREVSERVPVSVMDHGNGQVSLTLAGQHSLVSPEGKVTELSTLAVADGVTRIQTTAAGAVIDVTGSVTTGSVGGQLKAASGPIAQAKQKLDQLAYDVANGYNATHAAGLGLDGVGGRNLFAPPSGVANAARNMSISADVAGQPNNIAAATEAGKLPADNRNALVLAEVLNAPVALGGVSITESLAALVGFAGSAVQGSMQSETFATGALEQVQALHDNVSGVSSDEEMVSMMKFQRAYQASLKVIQTADEMYGDLLALR